MLHTKVKVNEAIDANREIDVELEIELAIKIEVKDVTEKELELMLVKEVKRRGGRSFKFISPGINGVPDRLVLLPFGRAGFVEVKAPGKKMRPN